jgi:hypothetical protein
VFAWRNVSGVGARSAFRKLARIDWGLIVVARMFSLPAHEAADKSRIRFQLERRLRIKATSSRNMSGWRK